MTRLVNFSKQIIKLVSFIDKTQLVVIHHNELTYPNRSDNLSSYTLMSFINTTQLIYSGAIQKIRDT
jgi:hypothetical protein